MATADPTTRIANLKPGEPFIVDGLDWSWAFVTFAPVAYAPGYMVASDGRILSCWKRVSLGFGHGTTFVLSDEWRELGGGRDRDGYRKLILVANGKRFYRRVHNLVLESFIGPCPPGKVGCHNNGDLTNNRLWNVRWDTQANNIADKRKHGTVAAGEKIGTSTLKPDQVLVIRELHASGAVKRTELASAFGVNRATIGGIVLRRSWKHI